MNNPTKVLVIDDSPLDRKVFEAAFQKHGIEVVTLGDPSIALETTINFKPDFVVLDLYMPDVSGFEVCTELKVNYETRDIPIVFITGSDSIEDASKSLHMGIIDYFHKPVSIENLVNQIVKHNLVENIHKIFAPMKQEMRSFCEKYKDGITCV